MFDPKSWQVGISATNSGKELIIVRNQYFERREALVPDRTHSSRTNAPRGGPFAAAKKRQ
jgi:hypothetical protein